MKKIVIALFLVIFAAASFRMVTAEDAKTPVAEEPKITDDKKTLFENLQLIADSITLISTDYVEPIKLKDIIYGAIEGMMSTLDDYSQFLDQEGYREITEETKGEFGGIGIEIGMREGILTVIAPIDDTPASEAGIESGDKIVEIDGALTRDLTIDEAVKKLRGDVGTKITLTIIRDGVDKLMDFTLTRAIIKLKSIKKSEVIEGDIGYVKISEFQERTGSDLRETIKKLRADGAKSLIIDLRNNPGGLLDAAVETADLFLQPGTMIVYTEGRDPKKRMEFRARKRTEFDDMALVVLVNKGSASAAEIFAGAMKDNKRGLVIGEATFGKGSVQTVIPLKDGSALRLTTAAYYTPSGKNLRNKGVEPDILVERKKLVEAKDHALEEEEERDILFERVEAEKGKEEGKGVKPAESKDAKDPKQKSAVQDKQNDAAASKDVKDAENTEKDKKYDNQLAAAVNVLKGLRIFEGYKNTQPAGPSVEATTAPSAVYSTVVQ